MRYCGTRVRTFAEIAFGSKAKLIMLGYLVCFGPFFTPKALYSKALGRGVAAHQGCTMSQAFTPKVLYKGLWQ